MDWIFYDAELRSFTLLSIYILFTSVGPSLNKHKAELSSLCANLDNNSIRNAQEVFYRVGNKGLVHA